MHFAAGMGCSGVAATAACLLARRGWRWIPAAMTAGGFWAIVPDMPRVFREDFPSLGLAGSLGTKDLERSLHSMGDLFFFHHALDAQPQEYALAGLWIILLLYNLALAMLMLLESRARHRIGTPSTPSLCRARPPARSPDPRSSRGGEPGLSEPERVSEVSWPGATESSKQTAHE